MDDKDKRELKKVLVTWYGPQAENWEMTPALLNLVIEMMREMRSCTAAMILVPEPVTFGKALSQLAKSAITRFITRLHDDSEIFKTCGGRVLLNYKSRVAMAGMGI
ncbi:hypothetical protein [Pseudomonas sp. DWP3-1-2]|uniref:hypothetical protein n=1 Tax=Pseudomonas sp. DWP3-1-2 TaxID=2804645 RepID=UPI003CED6257